jgi:hypothetical protein
MEETISIEEWESKYKPIVNAEGFEQFFYPKSSGQFSYDQMISIATSLAKGDEEKAIFHVWTRQDDDNGNLILSNGSHYVNRLDYCLTKKPWGSTKDDFKKNIVVNY